MLPLICPRMLYLYTESVSVYAVLREGVFVAESDGVFREEGVKVDAHVARLGSNDDFLQISTCGQNPQTASIPAFVQRGDVWSPLLVESFCAHVDSWPNAWS